MSPSRPSRMPQPEDGQAIHRSTLMGAKMAMTMFNLYGDDWDEPRNRDGWRIKEAFVGQRIGGQLIGASMSEVEPGAKLWPYHTHHANEEWVIVLRGEPTLRTPEGEQTLRRAKSSASLAAARAPTRSSTEPHPRSACSCCSPRSSPTSSNNLDTGRILAHDAKGEYIMFAKPGPPSDYWEGEC